ncbi:unnamed protein product, partial [Allacma fusca]
IDYIQLVQNDYLKTNKIKQIKMLNLLSVIVVLYCGITAVLATFAYPEVWRDESVVDEYFGVKVPDPYRWLENVDSKETREFVAQEEKITAEFLRKNHTIRKLIRTRLTELANRTRSDAPIKAGSRYFTFQNSGLQNYSVLYVQDSLSGEQREFLDVNKLSNDSSVSMEPVGFYYDFSNDGSVFAYSVQKNGMDWRTICFRNVSTGKDFPDKLENSKFPFIEWSKDDQGIFYTQFRKHGTLASEGVTNTPAVFYHKLGTPQSDDILIADFPDHPLYYLLGAHDGINDNLKSKIVPIFSDATEAAYNVSTVH